MDLVTLSVAKKFTTDTADGLGAVKGAPCTVKSIEQTTNGNKITFEWTGNDGTKQETSFIVENGTNGKDGTNGIDGKDGTDGVSPTITAIKEGKVLTLTITDKNGTQTVEITDGKDGDGSGGGTAEETEYTNADHSDISNVDEALDKILGKLYYVNPSCALSATPVGGTYEIGKTIESIAFTWTVNKAITSQTLTDCDIALDDREASYNIPISSAKTFTLTVNDGQNSAVSRQSYSFLPKVHYGAAEIPSEYNSEFILGLKSNALKSSKSGTYAINVEPGKYGFIALPKSYANTDTLIAKIGGFDTEIPRIATISHTNESGYTQDYNIFKTTNAGLGSISAVIS